MDALTHIVHQFEEILVEHAEFSSQKIADIITESLGNQQNEVKEQIMESFSRMAESIHAQTGIIADKYAEQCGVHISNGMIRGFKELDNYNGKMARTITGCMNDGFNHIGHSLSRSLSRRRRYMFIENPEIDGEEVQS